MARPNTPQALLDDEQQRGLVRPLELNSRVGLQLLSDSPEKAIYVQGREAHAHRLME